MSKNMQKDKADDYAKDFVSSCKDGYVKHWQSQDLIKSATLPDWMNQDGLWNFKGHFLYLTTFHWGKIVSQSIRTHPEVVTQTTTGLYEFEKILFLAKNEKRHIGLYQHMWLMLEAQEVNSPVSRSAPANSNTSSWKKKKKEKKRRRKAWDILFFYKAATTNLQSSGLVNQEWNQREQRRYSWKVCRIAQYVLRPGSSGRHQDPQSIPYVTTKALSPADTGDTPSVTDTDRRTRPLRSRPNHWIPKKTTREIFHRKTSRGVRQVRTGIQPLATNTFAFVHTESCGIPHEKTETHQRERTLAGKLLF